MDTFFSPYIHFCLEKALETWAKVAFKGLTKWAMLIVLYDHSAEYSHYFEYTQH